MSNVEAVPAEAVGGGRATVAEQPVREVLAGREVVLGTRGMVVTRTLPHRERRMVGAWCFLDQYGPHDVTAGPGMRVPPHPHTALQTVSWLIEGSVLHRDSLGNEQLVQPGQLSLMTAGRAIAHAEESPRVRPPVLHGVQLWVALPERHRHVAPHFEHHPRLPALTSRGVEVTVLMGELDSAVSPAQTYTPIVGAQITLSAGADARLPLRPDFEYAALALSGSVDVDGFRLDPGPLLYLGSGRRDLTVRAAVPAAPAPVPDARTSGQAAPDQAPSDQAASDRAGPDRVTSDQAVSDRVAPDRVAGRILLLGGEPFEERIVMWWNFVARSHEEIVQVRADWQAGRGFGPVPGYDGERLPAPPLPTTQLKPRYRHR